MRFKKIVALSLLSIAGLLAGTIMPAVASAASNKPIIVAVFLRLSGAAPQSGCCPCRRYRPYPRGQTGPPED